MRLLLKNGLFQTMDEINQYRDALLWKRFKYWSCCVTVARRREALYGLRALYLL